MSAVWKNRAVTIATKKRLIRALVWSVATYGCEAWSLRREEEKRIEAFEVKCYRRMLRIPWTARKSIEKVLEKAQANRELLRYVKKENCSTLDMCAGWKTAWRRIFS